MNIKPKVVLWENVKGVLDRNLRASFFHYIKEMEKLGYENKYEILNAIEFGIPQKRERIFVVSIFGTNHFNFGKLKKNKQGIYLNFLRKTLQIFMK